MATVQEIERDIKATVGNFPNQSDIAKYMGKGRDYVREMMAAVPCLDNGKSKQYTAKDVARQIYKRMT